MKISVSLNGLRDLKRKLKDDFSLKDLQPFWHSVGDFIKRQTIKERFDKEQSPDGVKWKPLSQSRINQRKKRNKTGNMKILQDTGELRRSIHFRADKNGVIIGSKLKYAATHQFGRGKIPARPYLGINELEKKLIRNLFRDYIKRHSFGGG